MEQNSAELYSDATTLSTPSDDENNDSGSTFNFKKNCFICEKYFRGDGRTVQSQSTQDHILQRCQAKNEPFYNKVIERINSVPSLVAVKARYHTSCLSRLHYVPVVDPSPNKRTKNIDYAMEDVYNFIEQSGLTEFTIKDFKPFLTDYQPSYPSIIQRLFTKFGNKISHQPRIGRQPARILYSHSGFKNNDDADIELELMSPNQKKKILEKAAEILQEDILAEEFETTHYPPPQNFFSNIEQYPKSLDEFFDKLLITKRANTSDNFALKKRSVIHSIITIIRPRSFISSIQLAIGTYIYRKCGSRQLIDILSAFGISSSYYSIQLFEASSIINANPPEIQPGTMSQYSADSTDHNVSTLDGKNMFHGMSIIEMICPRESVLFTSSVLKLPKMPTATELSQKYSIPIKFYNPDGKNGLEQVIFKDINDLMFLNTLDTPPSYATYLWAHTCRIGVPSWKGFMELISSKIKFETSEIICFPIIKEPPSNMNTIYTTLRLVKQHALERKHKTCIITFDQPLYIKARKIVELSKNSSLKNVVVRLGGFHLLMSYLGCIGYIMEGSGLEDLWAVRYTPESVKKMMSGHAYARAIRAHILSYTAIGIVICRMIHSENISMLTRYLNSLFIRGDGTTADKEQLDSERAVKQIMDKINGKVSDLKMNGPTAQLWLQYYKAVTIMLQFIEAERNGDWQLHLQSIKDMLPLFHAAGHVAYAKSAQIYLQDMYEVRKNMSKVEYTLFTQGFFTIRRTDKPFCGLWPDLTIEQTLNRLFGIDIKHGRGVTDGVITHFLLGMQATYGVMNSLEEITGVETSNSKQHQDLSPSKIGKDTEDINAFVFWMVEHDLFCIRDHLMSLHTGVVGGPDINCHQAFELGAKGMNSMIGKSAANVSLSFKNRVKPLNKMTITVTDSTNIYYAVDSGLIFQKICALFQGDEIATEDALKYELSPFPLSLFDDKGFMRKNTKSALFACFNKSSRNCDVLKRCPIVIDGGFLLRKVCWPKDETFAKIFSTYINYVKTNYPKGTVVVFDGYSSDNIGIKTYERLRRKEKMVALDIDFNDSTKATITQPKFLSNTGNKEKFVNMLCQRMNTCGIKAKVAPGDADLMIINTAIDFLDEYDEVAVVGNDTDLLVLSIALTPDNKIMHFHKILGSEESNEIYSTDENKHLKPYVLFLHAFSGCDTTSCFFNKGKVALNKILENNPVTQDYAAVFYNQDATVSELYTAGEALTMLLYGSGTAETAYEKLRYLKFERTIGARTTELKLAQLPPTKSALLQHIKRVYYQIQIWLGHHLEPSEWGWTKTATMFLPIAMEDPPAPANLLSKISCSCSKGCNTSRCSCCKAGVKCTSLCKNCSGTLCENIKATVITPSDLTDDCDDESSDDNVINNIGINENNDCEDGISCQSSSDDDD